MKTGGRAVPTDKTKCSPGIPLGAWLGLPHFQAWGHLLLSFCLDRHETWMGPWSTWRLLAPSQHKQLRKCKCIHSHGVEESRCRLSGVPLRSRKDARLEGINSPSKDNLKKSLSSPFSILVAKVMALWIPWEGQENGIRSVFLFALASLDCCDKEERTHCIKTSAQPLSATGLTTFMK